jgi:hypothetical protein
MKACAMTPKGSSSYYAQRRIYLHSSNAGYNPTNITSRLNPIIMFSFISVLRIPARLFCRRFNECLVFYGQQSKWPPVSWVLGDEVGASMGVSCPSCWLGWLSSLPAFRFPKMTNVPMLTKQSDTSNPPVLSHHNI